MGWRSTKLSTDLLCQADFSEKRYKVDSRGNGGWFRADTSPNSHSKVTVHEEAIACWDAFISMSLSGLLISNESASRKRLETNFEILVTHPNRSRLAHQSGNKRERETRQTHDSHTLNLPTLENVTMLKKLIFAVAPMIFVAGSVNADDSLLAAVAKMDASVASVESVETAEDDALGQADVDALMGDEELSGDEAIAACFRRIGYGYRHRGFGYRSCYRYYPSYRYCYRPVSYGYCAPVYGCYTPIYTSYWGCW